MIVQAKGLTKVFGQDQARIVAVDNVDLTIEIGELVMFMGNSGCGKTTLVSLLGCILTPDEGQIILDGKTIDYMSHDLSQIRREKIGFVFQLFNLIPYLTALENVMLPGELKGESNPAEEAKFLLARVGLENRHNHYPKQLSGGEQQRVALARAFASKPTILFADEPTGNLDTVTGQKVIDRLFDLNEEFATTLVLVTHDDRLALRCDRIIELIAGRIV